MRCHRYCDILLFRVRSSDNMSTRPGNHVKKKPAQKHQNTHAYKVNKYKTDPTAKVLKDLRVISNHL